MNSLDPRRFMVGLQALKTALLSNPIVTGTLTVLGLATFNSTLNFAASQGITFNGGSLFNAYTEGTFTVTDGSGASLALSSSFYYRRIGNAYLVWGEMSYPSTANGNGAALAGFPFTAKANGFAVAGWYMPVMFTNGNFASNANPAYLSVNSNATTGTFRTSGGTQFINSDFSNWRMGFNSNIPI